MIIIYQTRVSAALGTRYPDWRCWFMHVRMMKTISFIVLENIWRSSSMLTCCHRFAIIQCSQRSSHWWLQVQQNSIYGMYNFLYISRWTQSYAMMALCLTQELPTDKTSSLWKQWLKFWAYFKLFTLLMLFYLETVANLFKRKVRTIRSHPPHPPAIGWIGTGLRQSRQDRAGLWQEMPLCGKT